MARPPAIRIAPTWVSAVSPATHARSANVAESSSAKGKCTTAGWSGWPNILVASDKVEGAAKQKQEADYRDAGVGDNGSAGRRHLAGVVGGQEEARERRHDQDQQSDRDQLLRSAVGVEHDDSSQHQASGAKGRVKQRQRPRRKLSPKHRIGEDQPTDGTDGKHQNRNFE